MPYIQETIIGKQPKDKFNLSNDEYYMPKQGKRNSIISTNNRSY